MTPELSRRAGSILGRANLTDLDVDERPALVEAISASETWSDLPMHVRHRLEVLEAQIQAERARQSDAL